jgi:hypothetical protein
VLPGRSDWATRNSHPSKPLERTIRFVGCYSGWSSFLDFKHPSQLCGGCQGLTDTRIAIDAVRELLMNLLWGHGITMSL